MEQKQWVRCFTSFFSFTARDVLALNRTLFSSYFKKLVVLPSTACLGLELCRELDELQECLDDDLLSGSFLHYVNILKSIHIINTSS